jgi:hypothetical protein
MTGRKVYDTHMGMTGRKFRQVGDRRKWVWWYGRNKVDQKPAVQPQRRRRAKVSLDQKDRCYQFVH